MYRRPKFLEELLEIREQMSRDAFFDVDLFAEKVRSGTTRIEIDVIKKGKARIPKTKKAVSDKKGSK